MVMQIKLVVVVVAIDQGSPLSNGLNEEVSTIFKVMLHGTIRTTIFSAK